MIKLLDAMGSHKVEFVVTNEDGTEFMPASAKCSDGGMGFEYLPTRNYKLALRFDNKGSADGFVERYTALFLATKMRFVRILKTTEQKDATLCDCEEK